MVLRRWESVTGQFSVINANELALRQSDETTFKTSAFKLFRVATSRYQQVLHFVVN